MVFVFCQTNSGIISKSFELVRFCRIILLIIRNIVNMRMLVCNSNSLGQFKILYVFDSKIT